MTERFTKGWKSERFGECRDGYNLHTRFFEDGECYPVSIDMGNLPAKEGYVIGEIPPVMGISGEMLTEGYLLIYLGPNVGTQGVHRKRVTKI